jgi:hypothetical protein
MPTATRCSFMLCLTALLLGSLAAAQSTSSAQSSAVVPRLVNFSGKAVAERKVITGVAGATFAIYREESGASPLWLETQNIQADTKGNYTVQLGTTKPDGLPLDLFTSGEARWLGVTINGGQEQPRVLLLSVPYALKAADAETIGGLPASAFVLAAPPTANAPSAMSGNQADSVTSATSSDVTTTGGTANTFPLFTTASNVQNSILTQTSTTAINVLGKLNLPALGTATASKGFNSQPQDFVASAYNSTSKAAVAQTFQWQAESASNDTATPSGTMNLLYGSGTTTPAETGLKVSSKGLITFATGQTLPTVSGNETVSGNLSATGVVTGSSFEIGSNLFAFGSDANGNAFLGFAGNSTMTGASNTATGVTALHSNTTGSSDTASGVNALLSNTTGSDNTATGAYALSYNTTGSFNTASGSVVLNSNTTGSGNTGYGAFVLRDNTTGSDNTASGAYALYSNATGSSNVASGAYALYSNTSTSNMASGTYALYSNTTGASNTAVGSDALYNNTTGSYNTAVGAIAGPDPSNPGLTNSTAIGAFADVTESNALVLGSTAAQNGIANVLVGIDVPSPTNILTVLQGGGNAIADGWSTYSSRRWKTNIHPLENALSKVEQLRGVSYDLKDSGKHEIGVIAEEVGQVVPEVVSYEKNGKDARGVDYSKLTALLIEAVKQQQKQITQQQNLIRKQQRLTKAQQLELSRQQHLITTQQSEIADLSGKVGVLESSLRTSQPDKAVLARK